MTQVYALLLMAVVLATSPQVRPLPSAQAIALTRADLPASASFNVHLSRFVAARQLTGDTVPFGLSVKGLRSAGFRGLYNQNLTRTHDDQPYGYPWTYVALASATAA